MATPRQVLDAAHEAWNQGNLDRYLELYADEIRLHGYSPEPMDKPEVAGCYEMIFRAFDSPKLAFHEILWDGDTCAIRFTMTGRHVAEFMGVPATGTEIVLPGITILHFRGDRVIERFSEADMLGLLVQIGAVPASA
ncbi:MAG: ester cyclase [Solirubrobacteraceae bacterium]